MVLYIGLFDETHSRSSGSVAYLKGARLERSAGGWRREGGTRTTTIKDTLERAPVPPYLCEFAGSVRNGSTGFMRQLACRRIFGGLLNGRRRGFRTWLRCAPPGAALRKLSLLTSRPIGRASTEVRQPHELPFHTAALFLTPAHQGPELLRRRADDWNELGRCCPTLGEDCSPAGYCPRFVPSPPLPGWSRSSRSRAPTRRNRALRPRPAPTQAMQPAQAAMRKRPWPGYRVPIAWTRQRPARRRYWGISRPERTWCGPAIRT